MRSFSGVRQLSEARSFQPDQFSNKKYTAEYVLDTTLKEHFSEASEERNGSCLPKLSGPLVKGADNVAGVIFIGEVQRGRNNFLRNRHYLLKILG